MNALTCSRSTEVPLSGAGEADAARLLAALSAARCFAAPAPIVCEVMREGVGQFVRSDASRHSKKKVCYCIVSSKMARQSLSIGIDISAVHVSH